MHKVWLKDCTFCCHCALCFGSRWRTVTFEEETKEEDSSPARHASVWMHLSVFINLYVLMCMSICWEPCYFVIGWRVKLIDHCVSLQCLHQACTSASHSLSEAFMFNIYNTRDVLDCELNTFPQPKNLKKICILQLKTISPRGSFSGYSGAFFIPFFSEPLFPMSRMNFQPQLQLLCLKELEWVSALRFPEYTCLWVWAVLWRLPSRVFFLKFVFL